MRKTNFNFLTIALLASFTLLFTACPPNPDGTKTGSGVDPNETAATVNGTAIKMEEVERAIKRNAQGQESKMSQIELAGARLKVLEQLIQEEVLYQKAEAEGTIPTDEEVTVEINKAKTSSGLSKEEYDKRMKEAGETEESVRAMLKKRLSITKLVDKVAGKVEPPKDSEIEAFYTGNKEAFVNKRGVKLAAIVVDPRDSGQPGDTTKDNDSANLKVQEIAKKLQGGADFATVASTDSEDPSRLRKGDLGYISEDQMKQTFSPQIASAFMSEQFKIGSITPAIPISGKIYIFKLQERNLKEEKLTLESPGVRQRITDNLVNSRKQLLNASYAAIAMDEAKIENFLARKVVDNPNELSGARPATSAPAAVNSNSETNANTSANANSNANAGDAKKDDKKADDKKSDDKSKSDANSNAKADDKKGDNKDDKKDEKK